VSIPTAPYAEAVDHLPVGATLVIPRSTWEEYTQLLEFTAERPGLRVTYDRGRLEIMSPSPEHEEYKELVLQLARVVAEEQGVLLETRGATTWKRRAKGQGTEPDTCFYVANARRIIGKRRIDLDVDPPPDVVVEIDVTNESLGKFPIYAELGVPEIWRYDGAAVQLFNLSDGRYQEQRVSMAFEGLTPEALTEVLEACKREGQTAALSAFRRRLRAN
jgi:Uma2 family endonuclease